MLLILFIYKKDIYARYYKKSVLIEKLIYTLSIKYYFRCFFYYFFSILNWILFKLVQKMAAVYF